MMSEDTAFFDGAASITRQQGYLNTGMMGIIPDSVLTRWLEDLRWYYETGPSWPEVSDFRKSTHAHTKGVLAQFLDAKPDEVQPVVDTTAGMNAVMTSLALEPGDAIIVTDIEHHTGRVPWAYVARAKGLEIVEARAQNGQVTVGEIERLITERTRVISLSHVSFLTGARLDLAGIFELAKAHDIFFLVDGAQSAGALDLKMPELGCDAFAFPAYKWCMGPDGMGGLYVREQAWDRLNPPTITPKSTATMDLSGHYTLRLGASVFADSTPSVAAALGFGYGMTYLMDIGLDVVQAHITALVDRFIAGLGALLGVNLVTPAAPEERAGLVVFELAGFSGADLQRVNQALLDRGWALRLLEEIDALRASFHIFNQPAEVDALLEALDQVMSRGGAGCY